MHKLSSFFTVAVAISAFVFAYSPPAVERHFSGGFLADPLLNPGERFDGMVVTTGVENAVPFWILCSNTKENDHSISVDCGELSFDKLAIGHTFGVMDLIGQCINWEDYHWEMSVDGHPIDLKVFGVSDVVRPDLSSGPLPGRESFKQERLWNVILVNPTPGMHRLQGQAQSRDGTATYTWVVNFTIATARHSLPQIHQPLSL